MLLMQKYILLPKNSSDLQVIGMGGGERRAEKKRLSAAQNETDQEQQDYEPEDATQD